MRTCRLNLRLTTFVLTMGLATSIVSAQFVDLSPADPPEQETAGKTSPPSCRCVGDGDSPVVEKIEQALSSPLRSAGLSFDDTPLQEVASFLQEDYDIPIQLDIRALEDIGVGPDDSVTINVRNITLRSALRLMLRRLHLTYIIKNEVLIITTPDEAEMQLVACVYDVRDLTSGGRGEDSLGRLVDVITSTVAPNTWAESGGSEAEIRTMPSGLLVISQTQAVHEEIGQLLHLLRAVDLSPTAAAGMPDPTGTIQPPTGDVVTRYYMLPLGNRQERQQWGRQLIGLIHQLVPDQQWEGEVGPGQRVLLAVLPDRLVVRHRQSVVRQVERVLSDIDALPQPVRPAAHPGGRGGFGGGRALSSPPAQDDPFGLGRPASD